MTDIESMERQAAELKRQINAAKEAKRRAEREERQAREREACNAHYAKMFEDIGQPLAGLNEAQHGIVYAQAWEQGHAYGFSEVESHYCELAELARKLISAN